MTAKQTEIQEFTASAEIDNGKRSRLFSLLVFEMGQIQLCTKLVFTFVTHPKMHVCSWYGPLTKRNFRIDPCRLFNIFSVLTGFPPRLAGWGIFTISGGSRVQQIRLHPPSQPLLEACKDINFNEGAEHTCLKKVHRKKQLVVLQLQCYHSKRLLVETSLRQQNRKKQNNNCLLVWFSCA